MNLKLNEKILDALSKDNMTKDELLSNFDCGDVSDSLDYLLKNGFVWLRKDKHYATLKNEGLIYGSIRSHSKGFAFLEPVHESSNDIYISQNDLKGSLNGDKVVVKIKSFSKNKSHEGKVIKIVESSLDKVVGGFFENGALSFVKPDDSKLNIDIFIPKEKQNGATSGHKVVVKIIDYDYENRRADGEIMEILGHKNDPGVDILSLIHTYDVSIDFPSEVMEQAKSISDSISSEDIANRKDLRDKTIVTIDGADAKDLDDAVCVERLSNGNLLLGVHIADVSHYVTENSPLDEEAFNRGTSIYLVDRVIPMLPHRLSNGICSLNPNVDRLTLSCEMEFNSDGELVNYNIFESIINTKKRMTYEDVRKIILREDEEVLEKYVDLIPFFDDMYELSRIIREKRFGRGCLDFDIKEPKVVLSENGHPIKIDFRDRSDAEKLIEDFMLAANETISYHFEFNNLPFIYRIHEKPNSEKIFNFCEFITHYGYRIQGSKDDIGSKELQKLMNKVKGSDEELIISKILLRSMQQAKYSIENVGHFGLGAPVYSHFTSPIRRYPDLIVHRMIRKFIIQNNATKDDINDSLIEIAEHSSQRERLAVDLERNTIELKKCEIMSDKVGKEYNAIISSVTKFGFFVELKNSIEGLIHISTLDDHYVFNEKRFQLRGKKSGKVFAIGDEVKVRLVNVNMDELILDFELIKSKKNRFKPSQNSTNFKQKKRRNKK